MTVLKPGVVSVFETDVDKGSVDYFGTEPVLYVLRLRAARLHLRVFTA